jgi:hypothetical protein
MTARIYTIISKPLYRLIIEEKTRLAKLERDKIKSRRKQITMVTASQSLVGRMK